MRRSHFEALKPVCPRCAKDSPLGLGTVLREERDAVLEGLLVCRNSACLCEYPIIDGIPVIVPDVRGYVSGSILPILAREDLSETTESLLGDCCGPASGYDALRQHISTYAFDHYGDLDPAEDSDAPVPPGSVLRLLEEGLSAAGPGAPIGPTIDVGCSVGRTSFALAKARDDIVLGVDLNFGMLRMASRVLREGIVSYPRRRVGLVYDRREFPAAFEHAEHVDFWACHAAALPFPEASFSLAVSLNLLDCVDAPHEHLHATARALSPGGLAIFAAPYDWSAAATPPAAWLGGHSQRSENRGASEPLLRALLSGDHPQAAEGLKIVAERAALSWKVRVHDRSAVDYKSHMIVSRKSTD